MTSIEVCSNTTLEELKQAHQSVPMQLYVDDALLQCEGTWQQVLEAIVAAAADWLERVRRDMKGSVSVAKAGVLAKPLALADAIRRLLNALGDKYGGLAAEVVQLLGFDATAGVPGLRLVGQLARLAKTQACKPRLQQIATAAGQQATKLVRQGIFPAALHPVPVQGMSGTRLVRLQRTARAATGPKAQESSRTMTLYLAGLDPLALATAPPLVRWAAEIWYALMAPEVHPHAERALAYAQLGAWWRQRNIARVRTWRSVNGPISAAAMSAVRLGWCVADPTEWRNERGEPIDLRVIAPSEVERQVRATATRMAEIEMADKYGRLHHRDGSMQLEPVPEEAFNRPGRQRAHLRIIRKVLKSRAKDALARKQKVTLRAAACVAVWPQERREKRGYRVPMKCARMAECGGAPTPRQWRCASRWLGRRFVRRQR